VRAYGARLERSGALIEQVLGGKRTAENTWELRGDRRGGFIHLDAPPAERGIPGAGTVHHVAWGTSVAEHPKWVEELASHGVQSTPVVDRHFFKSIYFREPGGVLYEIADEGPGFGTDDELGKQIALPPWYEAQRGRIESQLTPIPDPRARWVRK
jgi:glyoxalase family protein